MIEYVVIEKYISSIEEGLEYLRGPNAQNQKLFINTNSIRNSKINPPHSSLSGSQKFDFQSMIGKKKDHHMEPE